MCPFPLLIPNFLERLVIRNIKIKTLFNYNLTGNPIIKSEIRILAPSEYKTLRRVLKPQQQIPLIIPKTNRDIKLADKISKKVREIIAAKENKTMADTELNSVMEGIDKLVFDLYNQSEEGFCQVDG